MNKITIKDIPKLMPDFTIECPNPECKKQITFKTQNVISYNEIECPYCKSIIAIQHNFNKTVDQLNKMRVFKK